MEKVCFDEDVEKYERFEELNDEEDDEEEDEDSIVGLNAEEVTLHDCVQ